MPCNFGQNRRPNLIQRRKFPQSPQLPPQVSAAFVQTGAGDIRIGPILAIPQVLQTLGARPQTAFARAGVPLSLFRNGDARLPLEAAGRLLSECSRLTGCPHFGLLVGERFSLDGLGPLGELMRHAPSVGSALRSLLLHLQLYDRGAAPLLLQPERDTAVLGYSVYRHATPGTELIYDAALAIGHRILSDLCGAAFVPLAVQFAYRRPARIAAYRRVFRAPVNFDAEVTGVVFASSWLARPIAGADAGRHEALTLALRQAQAAGPQSLGEQVELVLHQMLLSGHGTAEAVARLFGFSQRTLRRRLDAEGRSFQALVNRTRHELACQLLRNTQLPVTHIAAALQYADANAFTRAFHHWAGRSPTAWRAGERGDARRGGPMS
jgi:AraC-like DNA-binding protein